VVDGHQPVVGVEPDVVAGTAWVTAAISATVNTTSVATNSARAQRDDRDGRRPSGNSKITSANSSRPGPHNSYKNSATGANGR
jgi:hypothetical protein